MGGKLRVGVIGCGKMAHHHVAGYVNCGRYEVAALADLDESAMEAMDVAPRRSRRSTTAIRANAGQARSSMSFPSAPGMAVMRHGRRPAARNPRPSYARSRWPKRSVAPKR